MKLEVLVIVIVGVLGIHASNWQDMKSPADSPRYAEILDKMYPPLNENSPSRGGRITNGANATLGQFAFQIFSYSYDRDGAGYICGGSIIDKRWILTAAHCIISIVKVEVFLGATNRYQDTREGSYVKFIIVTNRNSIITHPGYDDARLVNDIGLIQLPEDAPLEHSYIGKILLPQGTEATRNLVGLTGTVSGFGRTSDSSLGGNPFLKYVRLPIIDNFICGLDFGLIPDSNICLQSVNAQSACNGDSGGPLTVIAQNGQTIQVGVVSFGSSRGCEQGYPQVFTRVSSFTPWIEATTGLKF